MRTTARNVALVIAIIALLTAIALLITALTKLSRELPTPTPFSSSTTTPIETIAVYDDFNNSRYDGGINTEKWTEQFDSGCLGYQENGSVFVTTNTKNNKTLLCSFLVRDPRRIEGGKLNFFEARMKISSDHNREFVAQVLELNANNGWNLSCGIEAGQEGPDVVLDVNETSDKVHKGIPILYDRWYKIRLEVDNSTMTFSCYLDDKFLAAVQSKIASDLKDELFQQDILGFRSANGYAPTFFDDVSISP